MNSNDLYARNPCEETEIQPRRLPLHRRIRRPPGDNSDDWTATSNTLTQEKFVAMRMCPSSSPSTPDSGFEIIPKECNGNLSTVSNTKDVFTFENTSIDFQHQEEMLMAELNLAKYYKLNVCNGWNVKLYTVSVEPQVKYYSVLGKFLKSQQHALGTYCLLPKYQLVTMKEIPSKSFHFLIGDVGDNVTLYTVRLQFVRDVSPADYMTEDETDILDGILGKIFHQVKCKLRFGRYYISKEKLPSRPNSVEVFKGFKISVINYHGDPFFKLDPFLCERDNQSVLDKIQAIEKACGKDVAMFQAQCKVEMEGKTVFTRYNESAYTIDDIDFEKDTNTVFLGKSGRLTFQEYYQLKYGEKVEFPLQPLLICKKQPQKKGESKDLVGLVPELCHEFATMMLTYPDAREKAEANQCCPEYWEVTAQKFMAVVKKTCEETFKKWEISLETEPTVSIMKGVRN